VCVSVPALAAAQQRPTAQQSAREDAINVFLDCGFPCDEDFLRTEITYVNWVRDRAVADVHVLVTTQPTAGSGTEYTLAFLGLRRFAGSGDTLRFVARSTNSPDDTRRAVARTINLGLVRFVARTPLAERVTVSVSAPKGAAGQTAPKRDPWNYWSFRISGNTNFNGERLYESRYYSANLSANRTTEAWKVSFNVSQSQNSSRFVYEGDAGTRETITSFRRSAGVDNLLVKSLTSHWSAGVRNSVSSSTYHNQRFRARTTPAVEFNVFPYAQSTRRQLRMEYGAGAESFRYRDTTIYLKVAETRPLHTLGLTLDLRQPWGSAHLSFNSQQYLDDAQRYRWSLFTNADLRLFKGFSLNFFGGYERLRDQIYLPAQGASLEEILTRQRQLETGFSYFGGVGVSYTFGSIYNNVVNPRFGGGGAGFFFFE
jgi:hypothetical protein